MKKRILLYSVLCLSILFYSYRVNYYVKPFIVPMKPVKIQPLIPYDQNELEFLVETLKKASLEIELLKEKPMPESAWYKPRQRYKANIIIEELNPGTEEVFIMGFTNHDISYGMRGHKDWGLFGLANSRMKACVVSTKRLNFGMPAKKLYNERIRKIAIHELGHLIGLFHCPDKNCIMNDCKGSMKTVDAMKEFCSECLKAWNKDSI